MSDSPATSALATVGLDLAPAMLAATQLGKEGVEVLERLHAIHKEERAFSARQQFASAMADLKRDLPPVTKSVPGQHGVSHAGTRTKGMYAPLDTICAVLDPIASKHGFSYRFDRAVMDGKDYVLCIVTHRGGHSETNRYPAPVDSGPGRTAVQAIASGDTYSKRYALISAFSIVTADPDDDGASAGRRESDPDPRDMSGMPTIGEERAAELKATLDMAPNPTEERKRFCAWMKVKFLSDIPEAMFTKAKNALEAKRAGGWK